MATAQFNVLSTKPNFTTLMSAFFSQGLGRTTPLKAFERRTPPLGLWRAESPPSSRTPRVRELLHPWWRIRRIEIGLWARLPNDRPL
ncbi:hypothetical protein EV1_002775 [Malus domestica]